MFDQQPKFVALPAILVALLRSPAQQDMGNDVASVVLAACRFSLVVLLLGATATAPGCIADVDVGAAAEPACAPSQGTGSGMSLLQGPTILGKVTSEGIETVARTRWPLRNSGEVLAATPQWAGNSAPRLEAAFAVQPDAAGIAPTGLLVKPAGKVITETAVGVAADAREVRRRLSEIAYTIGSASLAKVNTSLVAVSEVVASRPKAVASLLIALLLLCLLLFLMMVGSDIPLESNASAIRHGSAPSSQMAPPRNPAHASPIPGKKHLESCRNKLHELEGKLNAVRGSPQQQPVGLHTSAANITAMTLPLTSANLADSSLTAPPLRECLCPDLIVPHKCECVLVAPLRPQSSSFEVTDMAGNVVLHVARVESGCLKLMAGYGEVLAQCAMRPASQDFQLLRSEGELFASLVQTQAADSYLLTTVAGSKLHIHGSLTQQDMQFTDDSGKLLAKGDLCNVDFATGGYYRLRVAPLFDVSLALCSLLCIDHLSGSGSYKQTLW